MQFSNLKLLSLIIVSALAEECVKKFAERTLLSCRPAGDGDKRPKRFLVAYYLGAPKVTRIESEADWKTAKCFRFESEANTV